MSLATVLQNPSISLRVLLEITAGRNIKNWIAAGGGFTNTFQAANTDQISAVKFNGAAMTLRSSIASVDANPNSYYSTGAILYVNPPGGSTVFDENVILVMAQFFFSNKDCIIGSQYYEGRLISAPIISMRIEEKFGQVQQVGGGDCKLSNGDKLFSALTELEWESGFVVVKFGADLPNQIMSYADFITGGIYYPIDWTCEDDAFTLKFSELKAQLRVNIPVSIFDRDTYPNLPNDNFGKVIPIAYGTILSANPVCIDLVARRFKVAGHGIKSFDLVKIKTTDKNNNIFWNTTPFASIDIANGEFTLGAQWNGQDEIAVDFTGKVDSNGDAIDNPADIVKDLFAVVGITDTTEIKINAASFATAKNRLDAGTTQDGRATLRRYSLYLNEATDFLGVVSTMNQNCFTYLFNDQNGEYFFGVFEPEVSEGLPIYDDLQISNWRDETDTQPSGDPMFSKVNANYAKRDQENYLQTVTQEKASNQYAQGFNNASIAQNLLADGNNSNPILNFTNRNDAIYWCQRTLITDGRKHKRFSFDVSWQGLFTQPGDLILIDYQRQDKFGVFEVYDVKIDLATGLVSLVIGNLRGFTDQVGFWVDDAATLPVRFSGLTGYGSGSLVWNANWDSSIKLWARQNVGYWCDANGFAATADPDSFLASVWF